MMLVKIDARRFVLSFMGVSEITLGVYRENADNQQVKSLSPYSLTEYIISNLLRKIMSKELWVLFVAHTGKDVDCYTVFGL
jgi:hypothetical protein